MISKSHLKILWISPTKHNEHIGKTESIQREAPPQRFHEFLMNLLEKIKKEQGTMISWSLGSTLYQWHIQIDYTSLCHSTQKSKFKILNFDYVVTTVPSLCLAPPSSIIREFCTAIAERIQVFILVFSRNKTYYKPLGSPQPVRDSQHFSVRSLTRHFSL